MAAGAIPPPLFLLSIAAGVRLSGEAFSTGHPKTISVDQANRG
jgi:hypothetical protein